MVPIHSSLLPAKLIAEAPLLRHLSNALEASWDADTAYRGFVIPGNKAYAQCYPTSRVVQHYFPKAQILQGLVWTGTREERHFWNRLPQGEDWMDVDLTWQQFPVRSIVREHVVLNPAQTADSESAQKRCAVLLSRVERHLKKMGQVHLQTP